MRHKDPKRRGETRVYVAFNMKTDRKIFDGPARSDEDVRRILLAKGHTGVVAILEMDADYEPGSLENA